MTNWRQTARTGLLVMAPGASALLLLWLAASWPVAVGLLFIASFVAALAMERRLREPLHGVQAWLADPERRPRVGDAPEWQEAGNRAWRMMRSHRQRAEQAEAGIEQLRSALSAMEEGVIVTDASARIVILNQAARAMFGLNEDAEGKTIIEATVSAPLDAAVLAVLAGGNSVVLDLDILLPRVLRVRAAVNTTSGSPSSRSAVVVLHDLTVAAQLDRVRRDFVANVSHELRTPVAGIQSMSETLLGGAMKDPEVSRRFLTNIYQASHRLVILVDDLLQLARSEDGSVKPRSAVPVAPIAREVVAQLDVAITRKGLDVGVEADDRVQAEADPESLRQIIGNLVDNAVKYTPDGGRVDVRVLEEDGNAVIEVTDTGVGIPLESQARVFERFYRVDEARSRKLGGTGLGLSIVRHRAASLGGRVTVESEVGKGSTFRVELPAAGPVKASLGKP